MMLYVHLKLLMAISSHQCIQWRPVATMDWIFRRAMRSALALRRFHSTAFERRSFRKPRGSPAWGRCCDKKKYGETKVYGD